MNSSYKEKGLCSVQPCGVFHNGYITILLILKLY